VIKLTDATKLALTKLRTRKIRLFITLFISSLLFSTLFISTFVFRGLVNDLENFSKEGFANRYILSAQLSTFDPISKIQSNEEIIKRALEIQKETIASKKAEAKKLGIEYDPKNEPELVSVVDDIAGKIKILDVSQPASKKAIEEYVKNNPFPGLDELKKLLNNDNPKAYYTVNRLAQGTEPPKLKVIKDGKETFETNFNNPEIQNINSLVNFESNWTLIDKELLKPFVIDDSQLKDNEIPIVLPAKTIEGILKLDQLQPNANSQTRLDRIKLIREKSKNLTFDICYRNNESEDTISKAIQSQKELELSKKDKTVIRPDVVYSLPNEPCSTVNISEDRRTADQKKLEAKTETFNKIFGKKDLDQKLLSFRVIGIAPSTDYTNLSDVRGLVGSILGSNLGIPGFYTPSEYAEKNKYIKTAFFGSSSIEKVESYAVELSDAETARSINNNKQCNELYSSESGANDCEKSGRYFAFIPFGSNSLAIKEIKEGFNKVFNIAAIFAASIAAIVMIGTVGRTIADSRRETAVFRAIGAKRIDISAIYVIYTVCLALMISIISVLIALILSRMVVDRYANDFTYEALIAFNAQDLTRRFTLFQLYLPDISKLFGLIVLTGLLSLSIPLLRNIRRNPINDMRDEN
jgi:hypothetical protein